MDLFFKLILFFIPIILSGISVSCCLLNFKNILFLIPFSVSSGLALYIFLCHMFSFLIGLQKASLYSLVFLLLFGIGLILTKRKSIFSISLDTSTRNFFFLILLVIFIWVCSFSALSKFGVYDKEFHTPLALTMFHNNAYPPKDMFRSSYVILYHFGGDLIAGAIAHICKVEIIQAFEVLLAFLTGITFLSFFALAWELSKNFTISLLCAFCTYFGGGLLWLDSLIRFFTKNGINENWGLVQTILNTGIHGSVTNAPSVATFISTYSTSTPILILIILVFWKSLEYKLKSEKIIFILFLNIFLLSLYLCAEWLFVTFLASICFFSVLFLIRKDFGKILYIGILLLTSMILSKTFGSSLFLQDNLQQLGRTNILNVEIKENLFVITKWGGRLANSFMNYESLSAFSWDFLSEFGLSLILLPIAIFYLIKYKNVFSFFLFSFAITTMPIPLIFDFKTSLVDLNRLFSFGNSMNIILITYGLSILLKGSKQKILIFTIYMFMLCFSPVVGLISSSLFSPFITYNKEYTSILFNRIKESNSSSKVKGLFIGLKKDFDLIKRREYIDHLQVIDFLNKNSKPGDVAISLPPVVPLYSGLYTIIPANTRTYKDQIFSKFDNIYITTLNTLDPTLLKELNIKWVIINDWVIEQSKINVSENLNLFFKLVFTDKNNTKIYKLISHDFPKAKPNIAWILCTDKGLPIETALLSKEILSLFSTHNEALLYLNTLYKTTPELKKELITAQPFIIENIEKQIKLSGLNLQLEYHSQNMSIKDNINQ